MVKNLSVVMALVFLGCQSKEGAEGPQGPAGATGSTGPTGAQGASGAPGGVGVAGPMGAAGATGAVGATGATGSQGDPGSVLVLMAADGGSLAVDGGLVIVRGPKGDSVSLQSEPVGANCAAGGVSLSVAGVSSYVCTGATGATGVAGAAGAVGGVGAVGAIGPTGPQGPSGPRRVMLDGNNATIGPMSGDEVFVSSAGCSVIVIAQDFAIGQSTAYYATADCTGTAYGFGVSDLCANGAPAVAGQPSTFLRRASPIVPVLTTLGSYYQSGCQPYSLPTTVYSMFALSGATMPPLTPPFAIVTQ